MRRLRLALEILLRGAGAEPSTAQSSAAQPVGKVAAEAPSAPAAATTHPAHVGASGSSEMTDRLVGVRDGVYAGSQESEGPTAKILAVVTRQLDEVLALDRVAAFEDAGRFDPNRQNVVSTLDTEDPDLHYVVASSVRPGYVRDGVLFRRQDVILYRLRGERGRAGR